MPDLLDTLRQDYAHFPHQQSYDIYDAEVFFKDPMTQFRGLKRYQEMIQFMTTWFKDPRLELRDISQTGDRVETRWLLTWTTPLPWQPRIAISGQTEMRLNAEGKVISHIDTWDCSRWDVLKQHFPTASPSSPSSP
ncbi:MAG: DUF2358 domain-containing protein [Prochlorothrix sp.]|nr:DUF2358 domain-containing protein [Prochlorothrix sp.]